MEYDKYVVFSLKDWDDFQKAIRYISKNLRRGVNA
jgi:hypothetical protein